LIEVSGDIFNEAIPRDAICVTTNGVLDRHGCLVMGAGIALEAKMKFPSLPEIWGKEVKKRGMGPVFAVSELENVNYSIISFPTKYDWRTPSSIDLIMGSCRILKRVSDERGWDRILVPRPGCQNGKLEWSFVRSKISKILDDDRFVIVFKEK
jgi:hypothetical protein